MTAITWRNINGPSLAEASRPLDSAQRMISSGFDSLNSILNKQEATDQANWQQQKTNNLNDFMNTIYAAKGPEEFKRMQDSGELMQTLQSYGAQIDQAAARSAMDTRLGTLQKRDQENWTYQNAALDQQEAPMINEAKALIAQGKLDDAGKVTAGLSTRAQATLYNSMDEKSQQLLQRKWAAEKQPLELKALQSQIAAQGVQAEAARFNLNQSKKQAEAAALQSRIDAALKDNIYSEGVLKPGDTQELVDLMNKQGIGADDKGDWWDDTREKQAKIVERINKLAMQGMQVKVKDPQTGKDIVQTIPMPKGAIKAALLASTNTTMSWNEGWADTFEDELKKRVNATGSIMGQGKGRNSTAGGLQAVGNRALDDYAVYGNAVGLQSTIPAPRKK